MQRIDNDSPRQPVWQATIKLGTQVIATTTGYVEREEDRPLYRRCICGARPDTSGSLPCGH